MTEESDKKNGSLHKRNPSSREMVEHARLVLLDSWRDSDDETEDTKSPSFQQTPKSPKSFTSPSKAILEEPQSRQIKSVSVVSRSVHEFSSPNPRRKAKSTSAANDSTTANERTERTVSQWSTEINQDGKVQYINQTTGLVSNRAPVLGQVVRLSGKRSIIETKPSTNILSQLPANLTSPSQPSASNNTNRFSLSSLGSKDSSSRLSFNWSRSEEDVSTEKSVKQSSRTSFRFSKRQESSLTSMDDESHCSICDVRFSWTVRRHRCKKCLQPVCYSCGTAKLPIEEGGRPRRVCDICFFDVQKHITRNTVSHSLCLVIAVVKSRLYSDSGLCGKGGFFCEVSTHYIPDSSTPIQSLIDDPPSTTAEHAHHTTKCSKADSESGITWNDVFGIGYGSKENMLDHCIVVKVYEKLLMSKNYLVAAVKIPIIAIIRVLEEYSMHDIQEWYSLFIMSSNYERTLERRGSMGSIGQSITHGDISLRFQLFGWS